MDNGGDGEEYYTVKQAAKVLDRSQPTIRRMLNTGDLEGQYDGRRWLVPRRNVHERLQAIRTAERRSGASVANEADDGDGEGVSTNLERLAVALGRAQAQLELTSVADSTLREEIARLREELDEERRRRIRAETELELTKRSWVLRWLTRER